MPGRGSTRFFSASSSPGGGSAARATASRKRFDDDDGTGTWIDYEDAQTAPRFVKGERVRHRRFGSGTIQGLSGAGRDLKVVVAFDDAEVGVKNLLVAYAGLEREWESA